MLELMEAETGIYKLNYGVRAEVEPETTPLYYSVLPADRRNASIDCTRYYSS